MIPSLESFLFAQPGWLLLLLPAILLVFLRRGRGADAAVVFPNLSVLVSLGKRARHAARMDARPTRLGGLPEIRDYGLLSKAAGKSSSSSSNR